MKKPSLGLLLAFACTSQIPSPLTAGQVEADFNDLYLGNTMTRGAPTGAPNNNNVNTGSGFLPNDPASGSGGFGEYNNGTGVVLFEKGDLKLPTGASPGYLSEQRSPVDPVAQGSNGGVVFGSSTNTSGEIFTRFQERGFATPMTNNIIWFSFLFRADGPKAQGQLMFNPTENSDNGDFGISIGSATTPGAIALNLTGNQNPASILSAANPNLLYYDQIGSPDYNGNGKRDGVDVGLNGISTIRPHLIVGRIIQNLAGDDTIEIWLDPANGADPTGETPILTYTGNEIAATGLSSIGFKATRNFAPSPAGGPYTDGGHFSIDHFRASDQGNALAFVTGNVPVDPKLVIVPGSPGNFNFRGVYGTATPLASDPITVTIRNDGATNPLDITGISFTGAQPTPAIFSITSSPTLPLTLAPGDSTSITVQASSSTFETTFTNGLKIATSQADQDKTLSVAATFYSAGSRVNRNSSLDVNINDWVSDNFTGDDTPPAIVAPGFLGTAGKVLMKGVKPTAAGQPDNLSQTLLNGARDWELAFFFSPLTDAQFAADAGGPPAGDDRLMQVIIQSDNLVPVPAFSTFGKWTDLHNGVAGMINLAYLPAQGGFRVFNGSNWVTTGLPTLTGPADQNNVYLVRVKGTGFGTSAAKYTVSVSQPNSTLTAAISGDLNVWSSTSGQSNTPGAYTFTTGDVSTSGGATVKTGSYSLDEVSFFAVAARDPDVTASGQSVTSHEGTTLTGGITVTNTGFNADLIINGAIYQHAHVFNTPATVFPLIIPAGTSAQIPVNMINGFTTVNNAARGTVTLATNVGLVPNVYLSLLGSYTNAANLLGNWNFEVTGGDIVGDTDSFAVWGETPNPTASKDVPGLVAGSTIAAYLGRNTGISTPFGAPAGDFVLEYDFAFKEAPEGNRSFYMQLGATGFGVPLFYRSGGWFVLEGENESELLSEAYVNASTDANGNGNLDESGDIKHVYKMRFTGTGWNTLTPKYQFDIIEVSSGTVAVSSPVFSNTLSTNPVGASNLAFQTLDIAEAGTWVDNVKAAAIVESAVTVTGFSKSAGGFQISWSNGGNAIILERSTTLLAGSWETLPLTTTDFTAGTYNDGTAPVGRAFYRIRRP